MNLPNDKAEDVAEMGQEIYNAKLKPLLEPDHNNEYVAIHVDSGDCALGRSWVSALRTLLLRHEADGRLAGMKIGSEPDYGLAARLVGSRQTGRVEK
jgi:hypothetical protein